MKDIIFTANIKDALTGLIDSLRPSQIFVFTDKNVDHHIVSRLACITEYKKFVTEPGEQYKTLGTAEKLWDFLINNRADRYSLLLNIGGGVVTDLGGFVASTYKRGIPYINIPTSLVAQVDASVGGKTGVDFKSYKNVIGTFAQPHATIINTEFLRTLDKRQFIAGFAEMIKHALLSGAKDWAQVKAFDPQHPDFELLEYLVKRSVEIKYDVVRQDPHENKLRKVLNFGHTVGHALESYYMSRNIDILHGEAVAIGMIAEIYLSNKKFILSIDKVFEISGFIARTFPVFKIPYEHYDRILENMYQDKKNRDNKISFALLEDLGKPHVDQYCSESDIKEALNFYNQLVAN